MNKTTIPIVLTSVGKTYITSVEAEIYGKFAVHRGMSTLEDKMITRNEWVVTHIDTTRVLQRFNKVTDARAYAKLIEKYTTEQNVELTFYRENDTRPIALSDFFVEDLGIGGKNRLVRMDTTSMYSIHQRCMRELNK